MANDFAAEKDALALEVRHWSRASTALADLEVLASSASWQALESYMGLSIRTSLRTLATGVAAEAGVLAARLTTATAPAELAAIRTGMLRLRRRYEQVETVLDFYGDAVNTRTSPRLGAVLRGLDALAVDSMDRVLRPLGMSTPPVLTYLDKGIGASILRSGARLWDASLSPVAAIKITRHNLWRPTSLIHETGHQVAHMTGWTAELGSALYNRMAPVSVLAAESWRSWASEVAADVYAFALLGYAPLPALATVVDGPTSKVFRMPPGDPHPFGWVRVLFNVGLCRSWFGPGPWDGIARTWMLRHPVEKASRDVQAICRASLAQLPALADVCTRMPLRAFGGASLASLADPRAVAPAELARLAERAGASLYTSSYLQRLEAMRVLAWTVLNGQSATGSDDGVELWLRRIGGAAAAAA
ncbi:hypothetical protein [Arthrobacter sp. Soil762]|uniref:hypothetical protein n=1 Tax=Arthrobacter sp. Soil762 TaxID=1736401 RepID=UPI0006F9B6B0|nr:hypothetical protein [Arthrobacter sp. Soil762]KRE71775.1 hypothetical protein ASG77_12275 [Arthrobacter sp. Soil762]